MSKPKLLHHGATLSALNACICIAVLNIAFFSSSCVTNVASPEEYYTIGMAYFELGKYEEAERWLQRATAADKTITASEYNLGRIAFERGRYSEAARYFDLILSKDPENIMALKAAAYTKIKQGDLKEAELLYDRVLAVAPENADDGYNYALVLFAMEKYEACEEILLKYPFALDDRPDSLLLLARAQDHADKVEAIDTYDKWVTGSATANPVILHEYAKVLEKAELYAKALEQYQASLEALKADQENLKKSALRFNIGRLLLIADSGNPEGIKEIQEAVKEKFDDTEALEALLDDSRIEEAAKTEIKKLIEGINAAAKAATEDDADSDKDDAALQGSGQ